jgi:hypothetical protein
VLCRCNRDTFTAVGRTGVASVLYTRLNALMVLNIAGDDDDAAEAVLRARLGDETVEKWRY